MDSLKTNILRTIPRESDRLSGLVSTVSRDRNDGSVYFKNHNTANAASIRGKGIVKTSGNRVV